MLRPIRHNLRAPRAFTLVELLVTVSVVSTLLAVSVPVIGGSRQIAQSVIAAALFNSHGLGWYGRVPPWAGLLLTIVIFGLQIGLSVWWLGRFRYGPLEWAWRSLTYQRLQPFRLDG